MKAQNNELILIKLEKISFNYPKRILRLQGTVKKNSHKEALEILIFKGFSSCTTHPTESNHEISTLPLGAEIEFGELIEAPLNPCNEIIITKNKLISFF